MEFVLVVLAENPNQLVINTLLFQVSSGSVLGFTLLNPNYLRVRCRADHFVQDGVNCVTAPSNDNYFLHGPTNSYQSNYHPYFSKLT